MKSIIIRVDGNSNTGLGHIYRGIALAEMLSNKFRIEFLCNSVSNVSPIINSNFTCKLIPPNIKFVDEVDYIKKVASKDTIIVLDGYDFNQQYQEKIKQALFKLVYIDDLQEGIQQADFVINHSPSASIDNYKYKSYTKFALGFEYSMLRQSFINIKEVSKNKSKDSVFVSFGGADSLDLTLKTTKSLCEIDSIKAINIILGNAYSHEAIYQLKQKSKKSINIFKDVDDKTVLEIMLDSDIAISPASTTLMELLAVGTPSISGYFVKNQEKLYHYLGNLKVW